MKNLRALWMAALLCVPVNLVQANYEPLPLLAKTVDLQRYSGDWYVHGSIPIGIPFFGDQNARDYTERYTLREDGSVLMECAFIDADSDKLRRFEFKATMAEDPRRSVWKVSFFWPVKSRFQIIYLDDAYGTTVVATPDRKYAWLMSRSANMDDATYAALLDVAVTAGFSDNRFRRVPHSDAPIAL